MINKVIIFLGLGMSTINFLWPCLQDKNPQLLDLIKAVANNIGMVICFIVKFPLVYLDIHRSLAYTYSFWDAINCYLKRFNDKR
jgi:hypothetical protein